MWFLLLLILIHFFSVNAYTIQLGSMAPSNNRAHLAGCDSRDHFALACWFNDNFSVLGGGISYVALDKIVANSSLVVVNPVPNLNGFAFAAMKNPDLIHGPTNPCLYTLTEYDYY